MSKKSSNYISREVSWLEFNQRVLDRAFLETVPLLERVKFLAITASNLDEFMRVRFGGMSMVNKSGGEISDIAGLSTGEQIDLIRKRVSKMQANQTKCFSKLEPLLAEKGISRLERSDLSDIQLDFLRSRFRNEVISCVAPIAVPDSNKVPFFAGMRLHFCVRLKKDSNSQLLVDTDDESDNDAADSRFVVLPLHRNLERIWNVPADEHYRYMLLEQVIEIFLEDLFEGQQILDWSVFRLTRNGDVELAEDDDRVDLLADMEEVLEDRKTSEVVRIEIDGEASDPIVDFLRTAFEVDSKDILKIDGPLSLVDFFPLANLSGFKHLKDPPWPPLEVPEFSMGSDIFATIAKSDRIVHHPYQSYDPVINFIRAAAEDDRVIAIKQTLYRTAKDSEIALALEKAASNGKNVTCIVELKARFDEARNIEWAKRLEAAGIDVIYGVRGLKTHAKVCIVIRKEPSGIRRYMHFGTGNYNEATARVYSDISFFTCDEQLGTDAVHLFNAITGLSVPQSLGKIAAAPINLRETVMELIQIETDNAKREGKGEIRAKINSLVDRDIIDALYRASQAGVKVLLNVRGLCCLRPGKKGLSENIRVVSVVDRFLEHSRIFNFHHGGDDKLFISSADWMGRNLDRRVELLVPIEERDCKKRLSKILNSYFFDSECGRELGPDGSWGEVPVKKKQRLRSQQWLYEESTQLLEASTNPRTTVFQPHRPG